jgi:thiol-disulfide isomerase/thioredoxin
MRSPIRTSLLALVLLVVLVAGCGKQPETGSEIGSLAPEFDLERIDGGRLVLSELRGKAVLVDFWDTWCPPCREAMPHLQALSVAYDGEVEVVGVALGREGKAAVVKFVRDRGLTFPVVLENEEFRTVQEFGNIQSIPTTVLIDKQGVIRKVWEGGQTKQVYEQGIKQVLGA